MDDVSQKFLEMDERQKKAVVENRIHDCPYNHPTGTRCPNCADWPYRKGGAENFVIAVRRYLEENPDAG